MYTKQQLLDAFCKYHGYQEQITDGYPGSETLIDNPESKVEFLQRWLDEQETPLDRAKKDAVRQLQLDAREQIELETIDGNLTVTASDGRVL